MLILIPIKLIGQLKAFDYDKNLPSFTNYYDKNFGVNITPKKEFKDLNYYFVIWGATNKKIKIGGGASLCGPVFTSRNADFMFAFADGSSSFIDDKIDFGHNYDAPRYPVVSILFEIETNLGIQEIGKHRKADDVPKFDFNKYVTTISGDKPRIMFNADTIYVYNFPEPNNVFFSDKSLEKMRQEQFPYCVGVYITKKDRVTMGFKLFFSETGYKKRWEYFEMLSQQVWYRDDFKHEF